MAITYTEFPEKKRVEFTVSGQITKADYDSIAGPMEAFIDAHGTVQMIEVVDHFSGFDPGLLLPGLTIEEMKQGKNIPKALQDYLAEVDGKAIELEEAVQ